MYSRLHLYARRLLAHFAYLHDVHMVPSELYAVSFTFNFAYKHQSYMHNSAINMHSFGPSAITYFGYKQLGWHSASKTTCSQPLSTHWDAGDDV